MRRALALTAGGAAVFALSGCGHPQSALSPGGPAADSIGHLMWFILILFLAITAIMWSLIVWISVRRSGSLERHEPFDSGGGQGWIHIGGFIIPFVVLIVVFVLGLNLMSAFPLHGHAGIPPDIRITGHQWWWEVEYLTGPDQAHFLTANELHVPVGKAVDIDLGSDDVIHSFFVPTLHGKVDLIPGQLNRIRIQASREGVYRGQCAEYCGAQHAHMALLVVADLPAKYEAWLAAQLMPAQEPATDQAMHGHDLFMKRACVACHTIRGTPAGGRIGPDLTHIGSRLGIAANSYTNNPANLEAWVTHAQSLKPEVVMPDLTEFSGKEARDLVAYLQQLQ